MVQVKQNQRESEQMFRMYVKTLYQYVKVAAEYIDRVQGLDDTVRQHPDATLRITYRFSSKENMAFEGERGCSVLWPRLQSHSTHPFAALQPRRHTGSTS
jgi:hypothetical protein